jgi:hypothetical protein
MRLTNKFNLPEPIVNAVNNTGYTPGSSDITVTQLIQPPLIRKLRIEHDSEIEEDASDRVWALFGSSVHHLLEMAYKGRTARVEERVYAEVLGWKLGGAFDVLEDSVLSDYKVTSVYSSGGKIEWERQLNVLRWLLHKNGTEVTKLQITAIFRDWRPMEQKRNPAEYPHRPIMTLPIKMWTLDEAEAYVKERIALHQLATPPICSDEDRWTTPEQWALMKKGGKRAIKLYPSKEGVTLAPDQHWEHRPAIYRRCSDYCSVNKWCEVWNNTTF